MRFTIGLKTGSTKAVGIKNEGFLNVIKTMMLVMNGNTNKFSISGAGKKYYDLFKHGMYPIQTSATTIPDANAKSSHTVTFVFDFAGDPNSLDDFTQIVNARALGSLQLAVQWGDASDIFTTANNTEVDADATKVEVSYVEVFDNGDSDSIPLRDALANAIDVRVMEETSNPIDKQFNSFGTAELSVDVLPVPSLILSHLLLAETNITDGNPSLTGKPITHLSYENIRGAGEPILLDEWNRFHDTMRSDYRLQTNPPSGVAFIDWVDQRSGGLRNNAVDALKIKLLTASPASGKKNGLKLITEYIPNGVNLEGRV